MPVSGSAQPSNVIDLLRALVAIPSVNPHGDPGIGETGEAAIAEFVGGFLRALGADVVLEEVLPGRPNVIGRFESRPPGPGEPPKPRIVLAPHTDTVSVANMSVDPFAGEIRDGRLFGRGACDTKGTMAAMLWALRELGPQGIAGLPCEVTFVGLMGEEWSQDGSKHFVRHHPDHDFAVVGEPTLCDVVVKTKGALWPTIAVRGRAAHGSRPELGRNAIIEMARIIGALESDFARRLAAPAFHEPLLGDSTINFGVIRGGTRSNIVADHCELELDIRMTPALHRQGGLRLLEEFLAGIHGEVTVVSPPASPPLDTDPSNRFVRVLSAMGAELVGAPWFCDASWLAEGGIPAVAAGPGSIDQAHTADEWISLDELGRGVRFYRRFLESV